MQNLTDAGKEELALAILLWKDFKSDGKLDIEVSKQAFNFCAALGITQQFEALLSKLPPMKVIPR